MRLITNDRTERHQSTIRACHGGSEQHRQQKEVQDTPGVGCPTLNADGIGKVDEVPTLAYLAA